jgi:hypothetical protein
MATTCAARAIPDLTLASVLYVYGGVPAAFSR